MLTLAGLNRNHQDITADLHADRIKKHGKQIVSFANSMQETSNPFSSLLDKNLLFNISTGQASSPQIANSITECNIISERFRQPLKKNSVLTFASLKKKKVIKIVQKVHELNCSEIYLVDYWLYF